MEFASIIKEIGRGAKGARGMDRSKARELFGALMDGDVPDMEVGAILLALRVKGEDAEELAGFKEAVDERTRQIAVPAGPRCVILPTYNGARKQPNLMPLVAQLLARDGIPVLIQGRHDFDSRISPFKLLAEFGIRPESSLQDAAQALATRRIACLRLDMLARGLDWLLGLRPRLGVRNSGHTLAKLLDPCKGRSVRVVAVTHPHFVTTLEQMLAVDDGAALLMRGTEGEAYASPKRRPRLLGFANNQALELFAAQEFEDVTWSEETCEVEANAALIKAMLEGRVAVPQPILDQVTALSQLAHM